LSIARMTEVAATQPRPARAAPSAPDPGSATPTTTPGLAAVDSIATYIPTEVIAAYIAVLAALKGAYTASSRLNWAIFGIFVVITPLCTLLLYAGRKQDGRRLMRQPARWPRFELIAATIGFVLWACALPDSPFSGLGWYRPALGAVALIIGALVIGLSAPLLRTEPVPRNPES
jgi:hypothetical protein